MRILVACEMSGRVRDAFIRRGHDAISLDLLPSERPGPHRQEPLTQAVLNEGWDMILGFPPCTDLSYANGRLLHQKRADGRTQRAADFAMMIGSAPCQRICVENVRGDLLRLWRQEDQVIHPWWFGELYTKATYLWLKGLPLLEPTHYKPSIVVPWVDVGGSDGGLVRNAEERGKTFQCIADAMAEQWG